jgi:hypothetical protein
MRQIMDEIALIYAKIHERNKILPYSAGLRNSGMIAQITNESCVNITLLYKVEKQGC